MRPTTRDMTTTEVAEALGCSRSHVKRLIERGHLRAYLVPMSKHRRVKREELDRFKREELDRFKREWNEDKG